MHRDVKVAAGRRRELEPGLPVAGSLAGVAKRRKLRRRSAADVPLSSFRIDKSMRRCYSGNARLIIMNPTGEVGLVRATRGFSEE